MPQEYLRDRVKCAVPNPGSLSVGSTVTLGPAESGHRTFGAAFAPGEVPAYFVLSNGADRTITGIWTVHATTPETATITQILGNDRLGGTSGETFSTTCMAWCEVPAVEMQGMGLPIGASVEWNGSTLPPRFLWEDGANVSRTTYAKLFAAIGTAHGAGNGSTTFGLPDSRGRVAVGRDNMGGTAAGRMTVIAGTTLGAVGGSEWLHAHNHGVTDPTHAHSVYDPTHSHTGGTGTAGDHQHTGGTSASGDHNHGYEYPANSGGGNILATSPGGGFGPQGSATGSAGNHAHSFTTDGAGNHNHTVWTNASATGVTIYGVATGITVNSNGAGNSQNVQPSIVKNKIIFAGV